MWFGGGGRVVCSGRGGGRAQGGGVTDSLSLGNDLETTAPRFWPWTAPGFAIFKFTAPLFSWKQNDSPLKLSLIAEFHGSFDLILPLFFYKILLQP